MKPSLVERDFYNETQSLVERDLIQAKVKSLIERDFYNETQSLVERDLIQAEVKSLIERDFYNKNPKRPLAALPIYDESLIERD